MASQLCIAWDLQSGLFQKFENSKEGCVEMGIRLHKELRCGGGVFSCICMVLKLRQTREMARSNGEQRRPSETRDGGKQRRRKRAAVSSRDQKDGEDGEQRRPKRATRSSVEQRREAERGRSGERRREVEAEVERGKLRQRWR